MLESPTAARIVLTTVANAEDARALAHHLVEEKLAACVSIIPRIESVYHWQGEVKEAAESLLLVKTTVEKLSALEARLLALHGYETPEFLAIAVPEANQRYLHWLMNSQHQ